MQMKWKSFSKVSKMPTKEEISKFSMTVEKMAIDKGIPYMETILLHCENIGLEVELAAKLISSPLKKKLEVEARELNFLPKNNTHKLPV